MPDPVKLTGQYIEVYKNQLRSACSTAEMLPPALRRLANQVAVAVLESYFHAQRPETITTPVGAVLEGVLPGFPRALVVTTKEDHPFLGQNIAHELDDCHTGYIHMEGRRGLQALVAPIREVQLPQHVGSLDLLVVAKAVIATGCTAITLARRVVELYQPAQVMVAGLFYSTRGLQELSDALPRARIIVLGEPDRVTSDGILDPGLGILEDRLRPVFEGHPLFGTTTPQPPPTTDPPQQLREAIDQRVVDLCTRLQDEGLIIAPAECLSIMEHYRATLLAARSEGQADALGITNAITSEDLRLILVRLRAGSAHVDQ